MVRTIDLYLGKRLRRRRSLLGLTQQEVADRVGIRFQQIQKYECGANRVSAGRLHELAESLHVPIGYFFEGLATAAADGGPMPSDVLSREETMELIRAYYKLGERPRRRLLEFTKALQEDLALPQTASPGEVRPAVK